MTEQRNEFTWITDNMIKLKELISFEDKISDKLRIHLSKNPIEKLVNRPTYITQSEVPVNKPTGFWYGFGREWIDLVYGEEWNSRMGNYIYFVKLKHPEKMLFIKNKEGMDDLNKNYYDDKMRTIDWKRFSGDYSGIEINPFQGKLYRSSGDYGWYGGWDVASGCVWNVNNLDLKLIYPRNSNDKA